MSSFEIPVDKQIENFRNHIIANNRTILSSKFGDGKSYFLNKVRDNNKIKENFKFITIYPVNYQIVDNKDILELIKRDILFQLLYNEMIDDEIEFSKKDIISWFIHNKGVGLVGDLINFIPVIGLEPEVNHAILIAMGALQIFKNFKNQFNDFKKEFDKTNDDHLLDTFLNKFEKDGIYECDVITSIIKKSIKSYKEKENKQVVLIIEDLDRIDPAHLFRILNVLSANIDYSYKIFIKPDKLLVGNKFELDNIILVVDYENLEHIYHHFYGEKTDFRGYISKFLSSVPFYYSLKEEKYKNTLNEISNLTSLGVSDICKLFSEEDLVSTTMREIVQSFDVEKQIIKPIAKLNSGNVQIDVSFLKVAAIMKRLKWEKERIEKVFINLWETDEDLFISYVLPFLFLQERDDNKNNIRYLCIIDKDLRQLCRIYVHLNKENGKVEVESRGDVYVGDKDMDDMSMYVKLMLQYVL